MWHWLDKQLKCLVCLILFFFSLPTTAQEIHFSQNQAVPLYANPALTGVFNGLFRLSAVWRYQWFNLVPYHTAGVGLDFNLNRVGIGAWFYRDVMGDVNMGFTNMQLSLSYLHIPPRNQKNALIAGISFAYTYIGLDVASVVLPEQWDPIAKTFNRPPLEVIDDQRGFFRMHVGVAYTTEITEDFKLLFGGSINNAYSGNASLLNQEVYKFPIRYGFHAYGEIKTWKGDWTFLPSAWLWYQPPHVQLVAGTFLRKTRIRDYHYGVRRLPVFLDFGLFYRTSTELVPVVRVIIGDLQLGFSFDFPLSAISRTTRYLGGPEITLILIRGNKPGPGKLPCPET